MNESRKKEAAPGCEPPRVCSRWNTAQPVGVSWESVSDLAGQTRASRKSCAQEENETKTAERFFHFGAAPSCGGQASDRGGREEKEPPRRSE